MIRHEPSGHLFSAGRGVTELETNATDLLPTASKR
jgi:hypothetical protein